jgi:hypothetical protein
MADDAAESHNEIKMAVRRIILVVFMMGTPSVKNGRVLENGLTD